MAITIIFIISLLISYVLTFTYLKLNNRPVKSDTIVLFIGPDYEERLNEAKQLIKEGYANTIIIPAYHSEYTLSDGKLKKFQNVHRNRLNTDTYPKYYENTHKSGSCRSRPSKL